MASKKDEQVALEELNKISARRGIKKSSSRSLKPVYVETELSVEEETTNRKLDRPKERNINNISEKAVAFTGRTAYPSTIELSTIMRAQNAPMLSNSQYIQNLIFRDATGMDLFDTRTKKLNKEAWEKGQEIIKKYQS